MHTVPRCYILIGSVLVTRVVFTQSVFVNYLFDVSGIVLMVLMVDTGHFREGTFYEQILELSCC